MALKARSHDSAVWVYRWRECGPQGNEVRKSAVIGTTEEYTTKAHALDAAEGLRLRANQERRYTGEPTFGAQIARFIVDEKLRDARDRSRAIGVFEEDERFDAEALDPSTASSYLSMLKVHIRPRWGESSLSRVKPALVQEWLRGILVAPKQAAEKGGRDRSADEGPTGTHASRLHPDHDERLWTGDAGVEEGSQWKGSHDDAQALAGERLK